MPAKAGQQKARERPLVPECQKDEKQPLVPEYQKDEKQPFVPVASETGQKDESDEEVLIIQRAPPAPAAKSDRRTKEELLKLIAKYEAERHFVQKRLEENEEYLQHQRRVDNAEGERLLNEARAERDEARAELKQARDDLATQKIFFDGVADKLDQLYERLLRVRDFVREHPEFQQAMQDLNELLQL